jgi:putative ABC transport system permease protein
MSIPRPVHAALHLILREEQRESFLGDLEECGRRSWPRELLGALLLRLSPPPPQPEKHTTKGDTMLQQLLVDLRYGLRLMLRSPGFTGVALLTMALGIGANTAIFSIVQGVVLKPLPYPEPDRIVLLMESNPSEGWDTFSIAPPNYWDWEERNRSMELLSAFQRGTVNYTGGDRAQSLTAYSVSEDFLEITGGEPTRGRGIRKEDVQPGAEPVVVLTHGFWQRTFGGDPDVLDRTMILDGVAYTVVGVLPQGWRTLGRSATDLILPLRPQPSWYENRGSHFLYALGRFGSGMTLEQARSDIVSVAAALEAEYPDSNTGWTAAVLPLDEVVLGATRPTLFIFMASVGLILLIACANLANMTLARATGRIRELAVRTALGAGRGRVIRQLLVESVSLATLGGALGVALAWIALRVFVTGWPTMLPRMQEIGINGSVLLFSLGLSLASGVLFGLVPALSVSRPDLSATLRQGCRGVAGSRSRRWMRAGLAVAEVGLAVVLLVGTGLLVRSFAALQSEDPGFDTEERLVFATPLPRAKYTDADARRAFGEAALTRLEALPGVESVALTTLVPLEGSDQIWGYWLDSSPSTAQADGSALIYRVSPAYFETLAIPLLRGRGIAPTDRGDGPPVVVISESFAERHFPGQDPLGRRVRWGSEDDNPRAEIVGVVGDVQHYDLGERALPQVYAPFVQAPSGDVHFVLRSSLPSASIVAGVREAIGAVDPDQPLVGVQSADSMVADSIANPRFRTFLMAAFGLTALLLAVVGLYGAMAYSVSQRTREIGVRMALGATRRSVLGLVFREGAPLLAIGLVLGLGGALALSRVLESMLFGVGTRDPVVFLAVPLLLTVVVTAALLIPARRATRVDPVRTLAAE